MGKYSHLKDQLAKFENDSSYQQEIDKLKKSMALPQPSLLEGITATLRDNKNYTKISPVKLKPAQLAAAWDKVRELKEKLEEYEKVCSYLLEAISQCIVERFEDADTQSQNFGAQLGTFFLKDTPYPSVEDKAKLNDWLKKNKMGDLLGIHHKTLEGMVNDRLVNGEKLPPGVKVFMKTTVQRKK